MSGWKPVLAGFGGVAGRVAAGALDVADGLAVASEGVGGCLLQPAPKAAIKSSARMGPEVRRSLDFMLDGIVLSPASIYRRIWNGEICYSARRAQTIVFGSPSRDQHCRPGESGQRTGPYFAPRGLPRAI